MRLVTPLALVVTLALTAGGVAVPALAKEKKAEAAPTGGPNPKNLSEGFRAAIGKAQEAEKKQDIEGQKAAIAEATPLAKTPDELYFLNSSKLNLSIASKDAALQGEALAGLLDTGMVPAAQVGQFNAVAAEGDLKAGKTDSAIARAEKALAAGYKPEAVQVTLAQAYFAKAGTGNATVEPARGFTQKGLTALKAGAEAMKAAGQPVPAQWYKIGVSRAAAAKLPELGEWSKLAYAAEPSGENLRTMIRVFQQANPNMTTRENLDVLRLMSVSGGLVVAPDFLEYAEMASKTGIFGEVKSAIDAGRTKGVLNATQGADLYQQASGRIAADKSSLASAEADSRKAANGKVAAATADAYLGYADYAKAATLFELSKEKGGVDADEVNTRIGIAKARAGDAAGAKTAFEAVQGGARKGVAGLWLTYLASKPA